MSRVASFSRAREPREQAWEKIFTRYRRLPRKVIDEAGEWLGLDLKKLCFEEDERLNQTEYTQAALLTVCLAMEKTLEPTAFFPEVTAA